MELLVVFSLPGYIINLTTKFINKTLGWGTKIGMNKFFILSILLIISNFVYPQCDVGEVEIWDLCYSIEETTVLQNTDNTFGDFPVTICDLVNLAILDLDVMFGNTNYITGEIPECIGNLTDLTYLNLGWNELYGEIPESIGNLSNLTYLSVHSNQLTGEIPEAIGNLTNLIELNLGFNGFYGQIPESIGNLTQLMELYFSFNQLTGDIPSTIGNLSNLTMFSIKNNQFNGEIPETIGNLVNLISFNGGYNQLSGEIPESIGNMISLERLWLNFNYLSGAVPISICNLNLLNWSPYGFEGDESYLNNNQLCPPYPVCVNDYMGEQDIYECLEIQIGDLNNEGMLDVLDIVLMMNMVFSDEYSLIADINEDGLVNILDVVMMVNILVGGLP